MFQQARLGMVFYDELEVAAFEAAEVKLLTAFHVLICGTASVYLLSWLQVLGGYPTLSVPASAESPVLYLGYVLENIPRVHGEFSGVIVGG